MTRSGALAAALALAWAAAEAQAKPIQQARDEVVAETLRYLNVPYLWGGRHPKTGLDCSAFVQLVYETAGLALPRTSREQFAATSGLAPRKVLPGDLLFFAMKRPGTSRVDHVGLYVGRGFFVHASVTNGIHIESIQKPYFLDRLVGARKFRGF